MDEYLNPEWQAKESENGDGEQSEKGAGTEKEIPERTPDPKPENEAPNEEASSKTIEDGECPDCADVDDCKDEAVLNEVSDDCKDDAVLNEVSDDGKDEAVLNEVSDDCKDDAVLNAVSDDGKDDAVLNEVSDGCKDDAVLNEVSDDCKDEAVLNAVSELSEKLDQMNELFIRKIQHTSHEEKIVDQMHAELQKYKDDLYAQLVRPILLDIIEVRESIRRVSSNYLSRPEEDRVIPLKTFSDYTFDIQDILEKNNITIYDGKEGDVFNPLKQRAIKKVTTPVEELHGKVAESLSSGYEYMGKTISPEKIVVYVYEKPVMTEGEKKNG